MHEKYYPALYIGNFDDPQAALRSVGVTGHAADLCIAGMKDSAEDPVAYMASIEGEQENTSARPMLVMLQLDRNRIGLYMGFFGLLADSREAALALAVQGSLAAALEGKFAEPPTFDAFRWKQPRRVLQ